MTSLPTRGFTLVELLVSLTLVALLAAILLPTFSQAREKGRAAGCVGNLRQLGAAWSLYAADHDGAYPGTAWPERVLPYAPARACFVCPSAVQPFLPAGSRLLARGYAANGLLSRDAWGARRVVREGDLSHPASTVLLCEVALRAVPGGVATSLTVAAAETRPDPDYLGGPGGRRHHGGAHLAFADGHVRWHRPADPDVAFAP